MPPASLTDEETDVKLGLIDYSGIEYEVRRALDTTRLHSCIYYDNNRRYDSCITGYSLYDLLSLVTFVTNDDTCSSIQRLSIYSEPQNLNDFC